MSEEVLLRLEVRCDERAPRVVRACLSSLHGAGRRTQDLLLVASELVTNAIMHSGCSRQELLDVCLSRRGRRLVFSVRDPGHSEDSAAPAASRPPGQGGFGLRIVEQLTARWGERRADRYEVWAEVPA